MNARRRRSFARAASAASASPVGGNGTLTRLVRRCFADPGGILRYAPFVGLVGAGLYALGYLVISASLGTYGIREIQGIRPRYLAIGATFSVLTVAAGASTLWALPFMARAWGRTWGWRRIAGIPFLLVAYVFAGYAVAFAEVYLLLEIRPAALRLDSAMAWIDAAAPFGRYNLIVALVVVLLRIAGWQGQITRRTLVNRVTLSAFATALGGVLSYATTVFLILPVWIGGGLPERVSLQLVTPIPTCTECADVDWVLIDEDEARVIVRAGDGRSFEISRTNILAVTHRPPAILPTTAAQ